MTPPLATAAPRPMNAAEIERALDRLLVVGNALYVAAHPDDENTRLLAWLGNEKLLRAAYLSVTRGDGGQNLIGAEQGPLLGLIRTQELLAARRVDGAEQFFTRARDFGYSKTPEETLSIWGKDAVLADMVWVIRTYKPDVILTRFPTQGMETHGHHTASALLAIEAFRAAADPAFHPEQLKFTSVWQARRIAWNKSLWNAKPNEDLTAFHKTDVGGYNPWLGVSYGEMAADSRSMHKSQGFGSAGARGTALEYFQVLDGAPIKDSIFDGVDLSWKRVPGTDKLIQTLQSARAAYSPNAPQKTIELLLDAKGELERLPANPWKEKKLHDLVEAVAACAGLWAEASAADYSIVPGENLAYAISVINRSGVPLKLQGIVVDKGPALPIGKPLPNDEPLTLEQRVVVPPGAPYSNPYWLADPPDPGLYTVNDPLLIGLPERSAGPEVVFEFALGDRRFSLARQILFKWTDPVAGERSRQVDVQPPVMVNPAAQVMMFPDGQDKELKIVIKAGAANVSGTLRLELPAGWSATPASAPFSLSARGEEAELRFSLKPPALSAKGSSQTAVLRAVAEVGDQKIARGLLRIEYPHIPIQTLFPVSDVKLVRFDLKRGRSRIGYIHGAGDDVAASLRQVGYDVTVLTDEMLGNQPLAQFDAVVIGVRAYNTSARLPFHYKKLMDYVEGGGTLIAQYNTNNRISKTPPVIGPYPFDISQDRVTDEKAAVSIDNADQPLLRAPNRITEADFSGWIQERGLYFANKWDPRYQTLFTMNDPGESPKKGSLLVAHHGKGTFVYTGLAFFRQLPAGVPGAYRLFANLLAHGESK